MQPLLVLVFCGIIVFTMSQDSPLEKSAPWWEALREKDIYQECKSSCTKHSQGKRNVVELCDDTKTCKGRKKDIGDYAIEKCNEWSKKVGGIVPGYGRREKHEPTKGTWLACAIFCKNEAGVWYTPRTELEQLGELPFFPDGVWCHRDGKIDYYCQNSLCLPSSYDFSFLRKTLFDDEEEDYDE
ncbi:uncharacterized protein [Lepeophtheirus salmonis]|uniref:uncharacterized protein n=1 Tax=Lepeophtheirus salmonis TaxID=72036 RepID=UPI001AE8DA38|nr:uncharacterized protein LOC121128610 [Lepeophtheirus salmonis]